MLVWIGRVFLSAAVLGLFATAAVHAQNAGNQGDGAGIGAGGGFRALSGAEATFFELPGDVELVNSMRLERYGLTYERYQQFFGAAKVLGGQLTLHRDDSGAITTVIGAHYPGISPSNAVGLTAANARGIAERDLGAPGGAPGERTVELMIDPRTGRHFFWVETSRPDSLWVLWIGAQNGQIINKYDALTYLDCAADVPTPCGFGVEYDGVEYDDGDPYDIKDLSDLTYDNGAEYLLWSADERLGTYDYWDYVPGVGWPLARDDDNAWILPGNESPAQPAEVDGQYYGHVTNQYYLIRHGYDWVAQSTDQGGLEAMVILVHYKTNYNNAFWHGLDGYVAFGDGDQVTFRELVSLDVVAHELTHGVTDFTSNLINQNESGALGEAFSDIMAASVEFYAEANGLEPSPNLTADWFVGEDIYIPEFGTAAPGFRNMADPEEDGNSLKPKYPDHYSERYLGTENNGGVHTNNGIPNHAFYLLVNGGLNASCASTADHNSLHCTDHDVSVTAIGLADAEQIFFLAFTNLNSTATMCDARAATEAMAATLFGGAGSQQVVSTLEAWEAVGLDDQVCGVPANSPPDAVDDSASTPMGIAVDIDVLGNDSDPDGDSLSIAGSTSPAKGSVTDNGDGTFTYTPNIGASGADSFDYTISDGNGGSDTATVTVTVIDPNQDYPPTVTMTEPADGSTVGGKRVKLRADAGDDIGVTQVEFRIGNELIDIDYDGSNGWTARWDSRGTANGSHVLTAVARNTAKQEASAAVNVTVDNGSDGDGGGGGGGGGCKGKNPKCAQ